jgi:hypothetical protein
MARPALPAAPVPRTDTPRSNRLPCPVKRSSCKRSSFKRYAATPRPFLPDKIMRVRLDIHAALSG